MIQTRMPVLLSGYGNVLIFYLKRSIKVIQVYTIPTAVSVLMEVIAVQVDANY